MSAGTLTLRRPPPQHVVDQRRLAHMQTIDNLPEDWRALVHEHGFNVVMAMLDCGVKKAKHARHIINTVLDELSPVRGSFSSQGTRTRAENTLALIPREPTEAMINASMATVASFEVSVTKYEKHRLRLRAALRAATLERRT